MCCLHLLNDFKCNFYTLLYARNDNDDCNYGNDDDNNDDGGKRRRQYRL